MNRGKKNADEKNIGILHHDTIVSTQSEGVALDALALREGKKRTIRAVVLYCFFEDEFTSGSISLDYAEQNVRMKHPIVPVIIRLHWLILCKV